MSLITNTTGSSSNLFGTDANYERYEQLKALKKSYKRGDISLADLTESATGEESASGSAINSLYKACTTLNTRGSESLFRRTDDETKKEAQSAIQTFVEAYNTMVKTGVSDENDSVVRNTAYLVSQTKKSESELAEVGISIGENGLLAFDTAKFATAELTKLREVFVGNDSFIGQTQKSLLQISLASGGASTDTTSTYGSSGTYGDNSGTEGYSSFESLS